MVRLRKLDRNFSSNHKKFDIRLSNHIKADIGPLVFEIRHPTLDP